MATQFTVSWTDSSGEVSNATFNFAEIAADGSNFAAVLSAKTDWLSILEDSTDGEIKETFLTTRRQRLSNVIPSTGEREEKVLVRYQDNTTHELFHITIPCRLRTAWDWQANSDFVDLSGLTQTQVDFIAGFNTNVKSPNGNAVTIISIEKVGRNL